MPSPDSLTSAVTSKTFASFASDRDLITGADGKGGPCRRIRVNGAGSGALALRYADGSTDTITGLAAGDVLDVQAAAILTSGTSVASVTVFW